MKVLITGGNGQLGKAFKANWMDKADVLVFSKETLDVTDDKAIYQTIRIHKPDIVIHCAAYTAVDDCEKNTVTAFETNTLGSFYIAKACAENQALLVYISTDYVFDGNKDTPYEVTDDTHPLNIYGLSKWLGENLVRKTWSESYIVRTSWLYGHDGKNFVKTITNKASQSEQCRVIVDQVGSPTYADDLTNAVFHLVGKTFGIYHFSNKGSCSWYEFAKEIYRQKGADPNLVLPVKTEEYGSLAQRPTYSVLSIRNYISNTGKSSRHWKEALNDFFQKEENR
ncbi:dTDP-4-dehydrorhamnose reductase [Priestia endophytica]|uniref:dTDP-4-dehydrorhamnose reductase n=1 Tax=Priestia endophytica TaxID=135735 RepID=UPI00124E6503|nr:dTDP-4-dehydrorhamnose reductase [Priestia endophytica]KAB2488085.1 dTDP-4-dehydrorhamnose reductase [Priestia endophytica]